jgi:hypothetical protein
MLLLFKGAKLAMKNHSPAITSIKFEGKFWMKKRAKL